VDGVADVNARDRIGTCPWQNFKGEIVAKSVDDLHSDGNKLSMETSLTERGTMIAGRGYTPNHHDTLIGSQADGRTFPPNEDKTCHNWTSSTKGTAIVGHIDRKGLRDDAESKSWNSSHPSRGPDGGCSQNDLRSTRGNGLFYCHRFDGSLEDVFELQDKVAVSVAGVIEPTLQTAETARSVRRPTNDLTAYAHRWDKVRFAPGSSLEGRGFKPSVPPWEGSRSIALGLLSLRIPSDGPNSYQMPDEAGR
jgi:hypothetical protein